MATHDHKPALPSQADVSAFLKSLRAKPDAMAKDVDLSYHTVEKWYRDAPGEMSAVNLLRVIIALDVEKQFTEWLRLFMRRPARRRRALPGVLIPVSPSAAKKGASGEER